MRKQESNLSFALVTKSKWHRDYIRSLGRFPRPRCGSMGPTVKGVSRRWCVTYIDVCHRTIYSLVSRTVSVKFGRFSRGHSQLRFLSTCGGPVTPYTAVYGPIYRPSKVCGGVGTNPSAMLLSTEVVVVVVG